MNLQLSGGTAVVTGAGSGIGRAIARVLADAGASVAVADLRLDAAEETVEAIGSTAGAVAAFELDVTDDESVAALPSAVAGRLGPAGVLVNCAGVTRPEPFMQNDPALWTSLVETNYLGVVRMCRAFVEPMLEIDGPRRIVNISSDAGRVGSTGETVYAGTKGGVIAFSKSLAREVARHGVTVNCVSPGPTDTPLFYHQPEKIQQALIRAIPLRRLAQPEEIAAAVAFFASAQAGYVTGQVLSVSGGLTMVD